MTSGNKLINARARIYAIQRNIDTATIELAAIAVSLASIPELDTVDVETEFKSLDKSMRRSSEILGRSLESIGDAIRQVEAHESVK